MCVLVLYDPPWRDRRVHTIVSRRDYRDAPRDVCGAICGAMIARVSATANETTPTSMRRRVHTVCSEEILSQSSRSSGRQSSFRSSSHKCESAACAFQKMLNQIKNRRKPIRCNYHNYYFIESYGYIIITVTFIAIVRNVTVNRSFSLQNSSHCRYSGIFSVFYLRRECKEAKNRRRDILEYVCER